jgi:hypothetical protein
MSGIIVISIQWFLQDYIEPLFVRVKKFNYTKVKGFHGRKYSPKVVRKQYILLVMLNG